MRLIDADDLLGSVELMRDADADLVKVVRAQDIDEAPTINPAESGHWIERKDCNPFNSMECSVCKKRTMYQWDFCPNCGSEMGGDVDETD